MELRREGRRGRRAQGQQGAKGDTKEQRRVGGPPAAPPQPGRPPQSSPLTPSPPVQEEEEFVAAGMDFEAEGAGIVESGRAQGPIPAEANKLKITTPYMTKYEKARILGTRALQIR